MDFRMVSRGSGHVAAKASAYQSGERVLDPETGEQYDFSRLHADTENRVLETVILTPENCGDWALDRSTLWNEVEQTHTAKNSQLARWGRVNIPREIPAEQRMELVTSFIQKEFVSRGMIADIALQENTASDGLPNPHAHFLLTLRPVTEDGKSFPKRAGAGRMWNDLFTRGVKEAANDNKLGFSNGKGEGDGFVRNKDGLVAFREKWANHVNDWLEASGSNARCSHETYKVRGIDREPEPHIGRAKYGHGKTRDHSLALAEVKAVKLRNRLASASRYNRSGTAAAEAEQVKRIETERALNKAQRGRQWNLADEWGVSHDR